MPVGDLQSRMTRREFTELMAYSKMKAMPDTRMEILQAVIAQDHACAWGNTDRHPDDYLRLLNGETRSQYRTPEEQEAGFMLFAAAYNKQFEDAQ